MKLIIVLFVPLLRYFVSLGPKFSRASLLCSQNSSASVLLQSERRSFTPIQSKRKSYSFIKFNHCFILGGAKRYGIPKTMLADRMSQLSRQRSCFVFGRYRVRVSTRLPAFICDIHCVLTFLNIC